MDFQNGEELLALCSKEQCSISEIMIRHEVSQGEESRDSILQKMQKAYRIMETSAHEPLKSEISTMGGIIGGEAAKLQKHRQAGESLCGDVTARAVMYAMAVLEVNASMGLIVAAPTAGASGVVPGVLLSVAEIYEFGEEQVIEGLFTAGAVGYLFMRNASVSGAEAGCQAEVGVASAMAAAAVVELMGGTPEQCLHASAMAIANLLGLVCDPIAGLVESPCQGRNAIGASNALTCAFLALSGVSQKIPFDEMVETMLKVGKKIPADLRETALGGCAACKTGRAIKNQYESHTIGVNKI